MADQRYCVHGMTMSSPIALPGLVAAAPDGMVDLTCAFSVAPAPGEDGAAIDVPAGTLGPDGETVRLFVSRDGTRWRVRYPDGTTFDLAVDGSTVRAYTPARATLADTLTYLYGPVLALVLRMRGVLALHASAVRVDDGAVLFVGGNGAGKSTLAAACARAGLGVLSDDVVALREESAVWWASSSHDHVRLWPASEEALFGAGALPRVTPSWEKRLLPLEERGYVHVAGRVRVRGILVLEARDPHAEAARLEGIVARDALLLLVGHTAAGRLMTAGLRALELAPLGRLVSAHPPRRLVLPDDLRRVDEVVADVVRLVRERS